MQVSDSLVPVLSARGSTDPGADPVPPLDGGRRDGGGRRRPTRGAQLSTKPLPVREASGRQRSRESDAGDPLQLNVEY